ncbi:MAG TPA: serine--tRNA ligase [Tepidisphaeraceae bacterium]|nr:serine--tRNA ligase [Tepidisphaeraceae bacterium]
MIDVKDLRENPDRYRRGAELKRIPADIAGVLELDGRRLRAQQEHDKFRAEQNESSKSIGKLKDPEEKKRAIAAMGELKAKVELAKKAYDEAETALNELLLKIPLPPDDEVPVGKDDTENVEIRKWGEVRQFEFAPKDHVTLGSELGLIDIERGVKLAGTRSYFLTGLGCLLHQAVLRMAQDMMIERGFLPMTVPVLVRDEAMTGTGYFPLGRDQAYAMSNEDPPKYLVGTAEVSLTAYHMGEILDGKSLPRKYVGQSSCFRREAGASGKDTAGLYRIHQFEKVEQVVICRADRAESKRWHEEICANAEAVLQKLNLPYRVVAVCTGDLGQGQAAKYDIETWMPSRKNYGETHSASRFYEFQARRLNLRYRDEDGKLRFCHTLNNTVIASPRVLIPILELYQNADGSVAVPEALRGYLSGLEVIRKP